MKNKNALIHQTMQAMLAWMVMVGGYASPANAAGDTWVDYATVSMTDAATPKLTANRLCYTDGTDIACDGAAGLLITSGTLSVPNISTTALTVNGVAITGSASGDRITSGTSAVIVSSTGEISFKNNDIITSYIDSSGRYIIPGISTTTNQTSVTTLYAAENIGIGTGLVSMTSGVTGLAISKTTSVGLQLASGGSRWELIVPGSNGNIGWYDAVSSAYRLYIISSTGYIGVNTFKPNANLEVSGTISTTALTVNGVAITGNASGDRITSGTATMLANSGSGYISLTTGATTWGYLGSSATYLPLINAAQISTTNISATNGHFTGQNFTSVAGGGGNYIVSGTTQISTSSAGSITFITGGTQRMVIDSSGRVGIGTESPQGALDVNDSIYGRVNAIIGYVSGSSGGVYLTRTSQYGAAAVQGVTSTFSTANLSLNPAGGNVGIGTAAPSSLLDVFDGSNHARIDGNQLGFSRTSANYVWATGTGGYLAFGTNGRITNVANANFYLGATQETYFNGNVGIGTAAPSYALHVASGQVAGAGAYVNTSDIRLKKDITPLNYGLDTVMRLRPVGFNWKSQEQPWKKQHQIGLIAQEVESVISEVVTTADDPSRTKSLAYGALVPVLIKAIQELKTDNEGLRAQLEDMRKQVRELQSK